MIVNLKLFFHLQEWWTHLWLNEGYASFFENLGVDYISPQYNIWTQFVSERYHFALELDALKNSHPIEVLSSFEILKFFTFLDVLSTAKILYYVETQVPVGHPSEISEIFDSISYNKGASVIRMLYNYIGEKVSFIFFQFDKHGFISYLDVYS